MSFFLHTAVSFAKSGDASIDDTRARFRVLMADANRAPAEAVEADFAASRIPGTS